MDEIQKKEVNFLQRKRENDHHLNNDFDIQKENFTIQKNELGNVRNEWPYLINFGANNCKKSFDEPLDSSNLKRNNKIFTNDKRINLTSKSFISNNSLKKINFNVTKNTISILLINL